ncbi:MAG: hypothetical protein GX663_02825 [Clostridiales bacterium]|nr:hypothetical protein [Clostridiales bacterium]
MKKIAIVIMAITFSVLLFVGCGEKEVPCDTCNGKGEVSVIIDSATCTKCNGTGEDAFGGTCGTCYGSGQTHHYDTKKCEKCGGDGVIIE